MTSVRLLVLAAGAACVSAVTTAAQAPVITKAGDPSVQSDTIYKLAVDPASRPDDAVVYLLDDGVVRLEADGRGTRTYRTVVQVLRQNVVASYAERRLGYAPDHQKFTLNWARVLRADGTVISAEPAQVQETDVTAATTNPVYVNQKAVRVSLGGVAVGTIIDISYTIEETKPYHEGDAYDHWNVSTGEDQTFRSRFIYEVPAGVRPVFTEANLDFKVATAEHAGRRTYTWARQDVPKVRYEPFAPDTNSVHMFVVASLPTTWSDIASWYGGLASDRYTLSPEIEAKLSELVGGARSRLDTIRAVHRWVTGDIRYVSVSLGLGGYQPRPPSQTFTTAFGDCKDKTTLFIASMRRLGIEAHPVLLHSFGSVVRKEHPAIRQFNHVIAAVADAGGYMYTDLTAEYTPYGDLPPSVQGGYAVVVLPNNQSREVTLPRVPVDARRIAYRIVAEIATDGTMAGTFEESNAGPGFEVRRQVFSGQLDSTRKATVMRGLIAIIRGARPDSIETFDGRDLYAPVRYKIHFSGAQGTARTGGAELLTVPFAPLPASARVRSLEQYGPRKQSIQAEGVLRSPQASIEVDMQFTLPEGWRARVPDNVVVESEYGRYATEYSQVGRVLRIVRREVSAAGVYPPSRIDDVTKFFQAIGADENNRTIIIER